MNSRLNARTVLSALLLAISLMLSGAQVPDKKTETEKPEKIEGVLIDQQCSSNAQTHVALGGGTHLVGGMLWAYTHTRKCALMPECRRSGYGVATNDNRYLLFDPIGNRKALALLQSSKKEDDLEVLVIGSIQGDHIRVSTINWRSEAGLK